MKKSMYLLSICFAVLFTGCAKDKVIIDVYTAPNQLNTIKELVSSSKNSKELVISINNEVEMQGRKDKALESFLVANVQKMLTRTNFYTIHPVYSESNLRLNMKVDAYNYTATSDSINMDLKVTFTINNGVTSGHIESYTSSIDRYSERGHRALPSKKSLIEEMAADVVSQFIEDISPMRTKKLVYLKSLPDEISYTINYAKMKNFQGAVDGMLKYNGNKDVDYFYNLAVYYEGLAAQKSSFDLLTKANENYDQAMIMGGSSDDLVIKEKAKFDKFYDLFKLIKEQKENNKNKIKSINREYDF